MSTNVEEVKALELKLKELFSRSMQGDQVAYEGFLELSSVLVRKYLHFLAGRSLSPDVIQDLTQEVLISVHQKKHTFQEEKSLLPWLYAIARYRFIDHYRSQKRRIKLEEWVPEEAELPLGDLDEVLSLLTPKQQEMLKLIKVEGVSYAEAAKVLDMSVSSVKVSIHRLLKTIKDRISS